MNTLFPSERPPVYKYPGMISQITKLYLLLLFGINLEEVGGWIRLGILVLAFVLVGFFFGDVAYHIIKILIKGW